MIEGTSINLGGQDYIIPPLNLKQVRLFTPRLTKMDTLDQDSTIALNVEVIRAALSRNYPDITADQVEEMIDLRNMAPVFQAVMNQSGLEQSAGELKPVATQK